MSKPRQTSTPGLKRKTGTPTYARRHLVVSARFLNGTSNL